MSNAESARLDGGAAVAVRANFGPVGEDVVRLPIAMKPLVVSGIHGLGSQTVKDGWVRVLRHGGHYPRALITAQIDGDGSQSMTTTTEEKVD